MDEEREAKFVGGKILTLSYDGKFFNCFLSP